MRKRVFIWSFCWFSIILLFDVDADLVKQKPYMFTFIPDSFITYTHHLERFVVEIGLCCCTKLSNNWLVPVFLKGAANLIYCLRWATTHSSLSLIVFSSGGKWWPSLLVFKVLNTNKTTLSLEIFYVVQEQTLNSLVSFTCC